MVKRKVKMSLTRNYTAVVLLTAFYSIFAIITSPYDWIYRAVMPTFIAVIGFYLASGPVIVRSIVCALVPFTSLPVLYVFYSQWFHLVIGLAVIHTVLIGAFLGLLWGNVDAYLRGKRTPKVGS